MFCQKRAVKYEQYTEKIKLCNKVKRIEYGINEFDWKTILNFYLKILKNVNAKDYNINNWTAKFTQIK